MIIINVLPPEYRRRDIGINPITLSIAGAAFVNVIILMLWAYIQFLSIPAALDEKVIATADRDRWKIEAEKVKKVDEQITKAEKRFGELADLLNKKVYWAKTLSDFINIIATDDRLNSTHFQISIDSLAIKELSSSGRAPRGKKKSTAPQGRTFNFDWKVRIVGSNRADMGAHTHTLFTVFETSDFWGPEASSFMDLPDKSFKGSKITVNEKIDKAVTSFDLKWKRFVEPEDTKALLAKSRLRATSKKGVK
ncbi:MAG: hypothetical protein HRU15_14295 [Planctomycetes bacterium]|nr:hypothetical protein [Planctomycetota bacterium]